MSRIVVHLGAGKTGTSYLQACLAKNQDNLLDEGILYPDHPSLSAAARGTVTSGNGELLLNTDHGLSTAEKATIFSSEVLIIKLLDVINLESLLRRANDIACPISFIVYVRDMLEHSYSAWGQTIKRDRGRITYEEFMLSDSYGAFKFVDKWLDVAIEKSLDFRVFNYSRHRENLARHFFLTACSLDIDFGKLDVGFPDPVNRSLTKSEYELQRLFNIHIQEGSSEFISDPLVNNLPGIVPESLQVDEETYRAIVDLYVPRIDRINARIGSDEAIQVAEYEEISQGIAQDASDEYEFSQAQLDVLARAIAEKVAENKHRALADDDADILRDIALKIEKRETLSTGDAYRLMRLALRARPDGPVINQKLKEYAARLR